MEVKEEPWGYEESNAGTAQNAWRRSWRDWKGKAETRKSRPPQVSMQWSGLTRSVVGDP